MRRTLVHRFHHAALGAALLASGGLHAQEEAPARSETLPTSGLLGFETIRLPEGEHMGLVGGSLLFDVGNDWGVGPAVYGAATGRRGGLFVGGVELQRRWGLRPGLALAAGVFAGGGGGGAAPVGDGLMLRPALTLLQDLGPSLQAGLSLSHVRFPSGAISSTQLGVTLAWRSEFKHFVDAEPGRRVISSQASGLGFDRMLVTGGVYELGGGDGRRIGLAGARAEKRSGRDGLTWGLEAAGAARGEAAGYMELLGTAGVSVALVPQTLPSWRVGLRVAGGLGGGGAVPSDGGLIGKASATTEWSPLPGWTIGAELGVLRGINSDLRGRHAQLWLGMDLEPGLDGRGEPVGHVVRTEWTGALQRHTKVERRDGTRAPVDTIGLKLARYIGSNFYMTGQAHSAFGGGVGAYSIGLVGAGIATRANADAPWRIGAELLVGAAGGGGVQAAGGGLAQALLWAGWSPSDRSEWRVGVGHMRFARGGANSPSVELSWTRAFGMAGR